MSVLQLVTKQYRRSIRNPCFVRAWQRQHGATISEVFISIPVE